MMSRLILKVAGALVALGVSASVLAQQPAPAASPGAAPAPAAAAPAPVPPAGSTAVPGWNKPPSWDAVSGKPQYASVPGRETNVLIEDYGHVWRQIRNGPITFYGGILLLIPVVLVTLFYVAKGPIKVQDPLTGRVIERFTGVERTAHWSMGLSFVALGITGIVILWGKFLFLPIIGPAAFAALTVACKNIHNFVGPLFIFALVVFITLFIKENRWKSYDATWLAKGGGLLTGEHPPSGKFNGGEKMLFWIVVVFLCTILSATGLVLNFPNWNQSRELMAIANILHGVAAVLAMAAASMHIYLGTVGQVGAFKAMKTGYVDETWAKEHHPLWYDDVKAGKRPEKVVTPSAQPATGDD